MAPAIAYKKKGDCIMFSIFNRKPTAQKVKAWRTPGGQVYTLYSELAQAPHCLIAGATGSGKSTVMEGMICTVLAMNSPANARFTLIDTKRVALSHLRNLPHVIEYADTIGTAEAALIAAAGRMDARYEQMQRQGLREWQGTDEYIVIDEAGDILTSARKKAFTQLIQHISMLGRAAHVHLWIGSQVVTREVISTSIKANIDTRIALRTATAQESRNIVGVNGAETFPKPAIAGKCYGIIRDGGDINTWIMPRYSEQQAAFLLDWWMDSRKSVAA